MSTNIDVALDTPLKTPLNLSTALSLRLQGNTLQEIGDKYNITKQAVQLKIKGIFSILEAEKLRAYKTHKVNLFTQVELQLLELLVNKNKLKKATIGNIAYALDKVIIHNRLEQGLATEITDIRSVSVNFNTFLEKLKSKQVGITVENEP